jgi:hypothetical protein
MSTLLVYSSQKWHRRLRRRTEKEEKKQNVHEKLKRKGSHEVPSGSPALSTSTLVGHSAGESPPMSHYCSASSRERKDKRQRKKIQLEREIT